MVDTKVSLPGAFGGLTRFSEEYESKFGLKPTHIILFIILIIGFRIVLSMVYS